MAELKTSAGNIAGSVISVLDAIRTMQSLGVSECEIAQMASTNPAKLLGIGSDCGSIAAGKRADLVAFNAEKKIVLVMVNGQVMLSAA